MRTGRPRLLVPRIPIEVRIEEPLLAKVQLELFDAAKQRTPRGAFNELVGQLLRSWLEQRGVR